MAGTDLGNPGIGQRAELRNPEEAREASEKHYRNKTAKLNALKELSGGPNSFIVAFASTFIAAFAVHPEYNAVYGYYFGASENGIHLAAGPDRMHLMYEGLGTHIVTWTVMVLVKAGKLHCLLHYALHIFLHYLSCKAG